MSSKTKKKPGPNSTVVLRQRIETLEEKLEESYQILSTLLMSLQRVEKFTFGHVKLLKDKGLYELEELAQNMDLLDEHEDLISYWEAAVPEPLAPDEGTPPSEEDL